MRCFLAALSLAVLTGCSKSPRAPDPEAPSVRLAIVTDLKGYLEPCGCTSNPLGGIDRLAAQVKSLRTEGVPVVLLVAGDSLFDAVEIDEARVDQATRNAKTLTGILDLLQVDALLPGARDRAQPKALLEPLRAEAGFPWLATRGDAEAVSVEAGGLRVAVVGVRPGAERNAVEALVSAASAEADVSVVLVDGSRRDANRIGAIDGVDFVIQGGLDQDEPMPPRRAGDAWVLHASRQGQGLTVVDVHRTQEDTPFADRSKWSREARAFQLDRQIDELAAKIAAWESSGEYESTDIEPQRARLQELREARKALESAGTDAGGNRFSARFVELPKSAPRDEAVEKRMREHDRAVNEANRVAFADLAPPPLGPDDIAYVGSAVCSGCHYEAHVWWQTHPHGGAYQTLQERHKEYNLDCVGCHVTGYGEPGGSTVTHNLDGALVNVGCESCHGPGAAHVEKPEEATLVRVTPESTCVACHNEEHSDLFDYDAYMKTLVVPGHGLPPQRSGPH